MARSGCEHRRGEGPAIGCRVVPLPGTKFRRFQCPLTDRLLHRCPSPNPTKDENVTAGKQSCRMASAWVFEWAGHTGPVCAVEDVGDMAAWEGTGTRVAIVVGALLGGVAMRDGDAIRSVGVLIGFVGVDTTGKVATGECAGAMPACCLGFVAVARELPHAASRLTADKRNNLLVRRAISPPYDIALIAALALSIVGVRPRRHEKYRWVSRASYPATGESMPRFNRRIVDARHSNDTDSAATWYTLLLGNRPPDQR